MDFFALVAILPEKIKFFEIGVYICRYMVYINNITNEGDSTKGENNERCKS